jgi:anti-sigma B factor antagonist
MQGAELSTSACDGHVVVAVRGDLDVIGAADAAAAMTALVVPDRCLIIDMSALDYIDRGSLDALLRMQWLAWSTGGDVVLAAPQRHVLQLLALTGRDHAFLIHASVQAAAAGLHGRGARYGGRPLAVSTARSGRAAPSRTGTR